jgi:hypothetical protein
VSKLFSVRDEVYIDSFLRCIVLIIFRKIEFCKSLERLFVRGFLFDPLLDAANPRLSQSSVSMFFFVEIFYDNNYTDSRNRRGD